MEYTPDIHFMESRRNDRLGWHDAIAELVDNGFDAGATRVELVFEGRSFSVRDDGSGCDDVSAMIRFGSHKKHRTTSVGAYGVGVKDAWMWLSDTINIASAKSGILSTLALSRRDIQMVDGKWIGPDPVSGESSRIGTEITFAPLHPNRKMPTDDVFDTLGYTFMPAIQAGKQVVKFRKGKKTIVSAYVIPATIESVDAEFEIEGKRVTLHIGIAAEAEKIKKPGFCLCYGHRCLRPTTLGTGQYSSSRMVGTISLGHGWKLTPHKNDLAEFSDELELAIYERIRGLLEKAEQLSEDIASNQLRYELEVDLNAALRDAKGKEKRDKGDDEGTAKPTGTGGPRRKATSVDISQRGSVDVPGDDTRKRRNGIKLDWCHIEPEKIGQCDQVAKTVLLNLDNEFIAHAKKTANREALYAVAMGLLCHDVANSDRNQPFLFETKDFIGNWGLVMNSLRFNGAAHG